jgi:predicted helicase
MIFFLKKFITGFDKNDIVKRLNDFIEKSYSDEDLARKYDLKLRDNDKWDLAKSRKEIQNTGIIQSNFKIQNYRCFDKRFIYYDNTFVARLNTKVLRHLNLNNISLISTRQLADDNFNHIFVSNIISDQCFISNKTKEGCQVFPLYLYPEISEQEIIEQTTYRTPNLNIQILNQIADKLGLIFTNEKEKAENTFAPIDILDYIYAVLHSPTYREKYKEFLKIDFPRVPYPKDAATFWQLVNLGAQIRQIHLLESPIVEQYITQYPIDGDNMVTKPTYQDGKVYINDTQYFNNVPQVAWEFYIGGYQPAQKWLKDRKDRKLEFEDILHYQKIIVALTETDRLMKEINKIDIE